MVTFTGKRLLLVMTIILIIVSHPVVRMSNRLFTASVAEYKKFVTSTVTINSSEQV